MLKILNHVLNFIHEHICAHCVCSTVYGNIFSSVSPWVLRIKLRSSSSISSKERTRSKQKTQIKRHYGILIEHVNFSFTSWDSVSPEVPKNWNLCIATQLHWERLIADHTLTNTAIIHGFSLVAITLRYLLL